MRDNRLHVVLGTLGEERTLLKSLNDAFEAAGYINPLIVFRTLKLSVIQYVEENRDVDVIILQEGLESSNFFQVTDYAKMLDLNNKLILIPILSEATMRNKQTLLELYRNNLLTAVFSEAKIPDIVRLVSHGRTRVEARDYYGISDQLSSESGDVADYDSCVQFILSTDNGTLESRLKYIRRRVSANDFRIVLNRLPMNIIIEASKLDEFSLIIKEVFPELSNPVQPQQHRLLQKLNDAVALNPALSHGEKSSGGFTAPVLVDYLTAVKKVVFGFAGAQEHIGATFNAIALAHYLAKNNYKVAVVEDASQKHLSFSALNDRAAKSDSPEAFFQLKKVHYYPQFPLQNLSNLLLVTDYNFVIIDFGLFRPEIVPEFNRCILPVIVSGSKMWEMPFLEQIIEQEIDENTIANYSYLFSAAGPAAKRTIINNMGKLNNIFFADHLTNPLSGEGYPAMEKMVGSYLPIAVSTKEKGDSVFDKVKRLFE